MKNRFYYIYRVFVGILFCTLILWVLDGLYFQNMRREDERIQNKNELLENWRKNQENIVALKNHIEDVPEIYSFSSYNDFFSFSIGNQSLDYNTEPSNFINEYSIKNGWVNLDTFEYNPKIHSVDFSGSKNSEYLKLIYSETEITQTYIDKMIELISLSECNGFRRHGGDIHITHSGNSAFGGFEYIFIADTNSISKMSKTNTLDYRTYWQEMEGWVCY